MVDLWNKRSFPTPVDMVTQNVISYHFFFVNNVTGERQCTIFTLILNYIQIRKKMHCAIFRKS